MISKSSWKTNSRSPGKRIKLNRIPVLSFLNLITSALPLNTHEWWHQDLWWHLLFLAQIPHEDSEEELPAHVNAEMMGSTGTTCKHRLPNSTQCFPQQYWLHQRDKVQKANKPTHFGTWRWGSWLKLWPRMPVKKCQACYHMSRNPFWRENTTAFILESIHSKDCTHFVLLTQHLIINMKKNLILSSSEQFCWFIVSFKTDDSCKQSKTSLKALNAQKFSYIFLWCITVWQLSTGESFRSMVTKSIRILQCILLSDCSNISKRIKWQGHILCFYSAVIITDPELQQALCNIQVL